MSRYRLYTNILEKCLKPVIKVIFFKLLSNAFLTKLSKLLYEEMSNYNLTYFYVNFRFLYQQFNTYSIFLLFLCFRCRPIWNIVSKYWSELRIVLIIILIKVFCHMMSANIVADKMIKLQDNILRVFSHESSHEYIIEFIFSMPATVWLSSQLA